MALTPKGKKILSSMKKFYGVKKGTQVFNSMVEEKKLKGVEVNSKKTKAKVTKKR